MNYATQERTVRPSALSFRDLIRSGRISIPEAGPSAEDPSYTQPR